jgi:hypothetical protein
MKRIALLPVLFFTGCILYGQAFDYKPFFTVKVIDNEDTEFVFADMRYFDSSEDQKYFFWIRRGSKQGTATYQIDFKKIKSIIFNADYDDPIPGYTSSKMTLVSGEVFDVLVNSNGKIGGMDQDFGIYGEIYMNYNILKSIEFIHEGEYSKCPFCGALFYNTDYSLCPFDQTALVRQNREE